MGWLVGEVWVLCAVACLAGGGVACLVFTRRRRLFVRPEQRPRPAARTGPTGMARWAPEPQAVGTEKRPPVDSPPPSPSLATDPALAVLDCDPAAVWCRPDAPAAAVDALDVLGVAPATGPASTGWGIAGAAVQAGDTPTATAPAGGDRPGDNRAEDSPAEDGPGDLSTAKDDAGENVRAGRVPEPRRPEQEADDIPAQGGGRVERPLQIPVQAGPRDVRFRPDGNGRA